MAHFDSRYIATKVIMMLSESLRDLKLDFGENTKQALRKFSETAKGLNWQTYKIVDC